MSDVGVSDVGVSDVGVSDVGVRGAAAPKEPMTYVELGFEH